MNVRLGSKADENGPSAPGPLSDLKLTQFGVNRTLGARRSAFWPTAEVRGDTAEQPLLAITGLNGDLAILDAKLKADEALALIGGRTAVDEPAGP